MLNIDLSSWRGFLAQNKFVSSYFSGGQEGYKGCFVLVEPGKDPVFAENGGMSGEHTTCNYCSAEFKQSTKTPEEYFLSEFSVVFPQSFTGWLKYGMDYIRVVNGKHGTFYVGASGKECTMCPSLWDDIVSEVYFSVVNYDELTPSIKYLDDLFNVDAGAVKAPEQIEEKIFAGGFKTKSIFFPNQDLADKSVKEETAQPSPVFTKSGLVVKNVVGESVKPELPAKLTKKAMNEAPVGTVITSKDPYPDGLSYVKTTKTGWKAVYPGATALFTTTDFPNPISYDFQWGEAVKPETTIQLVGNYINLDNIDESSVTDVTINDVADGLVMRAKALDHELPWLVARDLARLMSACTRCVKCQHPDQKVSKGDTLCSTHFKPPGKPLNIQYGKNTFTVELPKDGTVWSTGSFSYVYVFDADGEFDSYYGISGKKDAKVPNPAAKKLHQLYPEPDWKKNSKPMSFSVPGEVTVVLNVPENGTVLYYAYSGSFLVFDSQGNNGQQFLADGVFVGWINDNLAGFKGNKDFKQIYPAVQNKSDVKKYPPSGNTYSTYSAGKVYADGTIMEGVSYGEWMDLQEKQAKLNEFWQVDYKPPIFE